MRCRPFRPAFGALALVAAVWAAFSADQASGAEGASGAPPSADASPALDSGSSLRSGEMASARPTLNGAAAPSLSAGRSTLLPPRLITGNLTYLPKVYFDRYSGVGFGGQLRYALPWGESLPGRAGSSLFFEGRVTTQGQSKFELKAEFHPEDSPFFVRAKVLHSNISRRFWGVGSGTLDEALELYRPRQTLGYVELFRQMRDDLRVGLRAEVEHQEYLEVEDGGVLQTGGLPGTDGGTAVGMGLTLDWDRRDDAFYPTSGFYYQGFAMLFNRALGSRYTFNQYNFDLRHYLPVPGGSVLALQVFGYSSQGDQTPFWRYAALGGRVHSRGYRKGRYLDRTLFAFQGELRLPVIWRFAPSAFAGLSEVADNFEEIEFSQMRPTVGAGLRARLDDSGRKWARIDAAYGQELRLYVGLGVAF